MTGDVVAWETAEELPTQIVPLKTKGSVSHMFDRLPTPYGLVRSGVAPDHQHIKQVVKVFEALAKDPRLTFVGNIEVGRDIALGDLRSRYDAVILAHGAAAEAHLLYERVSDYFP